MLNCHAVVADDLRKRLPLWHPDLPFIVLWSQKAGATVTARWVFLQLDMLTAEIGRSLMGTNQFRRKVFQTRKNYMPDLSDAVHRGVPVIKFVRDPYARAYSIYIACCGTVRSFGTGNWQDMARTSFLADTTQQHEPDRAFSFRQWLEWLAIKGTDTFDGHIRQQYMPRDDAMQARIVPLENLAAELASLEREFSLPHAAADHPEIFESRHHKSKTDMSRDEALALLDQPIPRQRPDNFPYVRFTRELASGTDFESLVAACYPDDVSRYG